jgi:hypothetical protein
VRPSWLENPIADAPAAVPGNPGTFDRPPAILWTEPSAATAPLDAPTTAAPPPTFGRVARGIVGLTIAIGVLGVGAFGFAIVSLVAGSVGTAGNVPPGTVAFGSQGSLKSCSVFGQATTMQAKTDTVFIGHFKRPATALDEVRLRVSFDGQEIINEVEKKGIYACLGTDTPETDLGVGTYHFAMYLNNELTAEGTLVVR